mmetsp:Transcript_11321/g.18430  ORF Transcript_11321/g.18430 Transcript_11321/m.18430 type:complete len:97 (+) Transcript_11321:6643-6933(+)
MRGVITGCTRGRPAPNQSKMSSRAARPPSSRSHSSNDKKSYRVVSLRCNGTTRKANHKGSFKNHGPAAAAKKAHKFFPKSVNSAVVELKLITPGNL